MHFFKTEFLKIYFKNQIRNQATTITTIYLTPRHQKGLIIQIYFALFALFKISSADSVGVNYK